MAVWIFPIELDPGSDTPLFLQIARAISDDVLRGRLRPGSPLPGSRTLAATLGVHRNTVVSAYAELGAQGWLVARAGGVTAIAATSPDVAPRRADRPRPGVPRETAFPLASRPPVPWRAEARPGPRGVLALWGGVPDLRLLDTRRLGRALRRAARLQGQRLLAYSSETRGHPRLRAELARMVSSARGLAAGADDVMVTQGSQMALDLVARALLLPGDEVAVEATGYRPAWRAFHAAGGSLHPVPVDGEGLDVSALEALAGRGRLRAVYVTPHHQYPTTVTLSPRRRMALLALARAHRFAVVEDDFDHEFHYAGRPVLPLASADRHGSVVYVGTLAKILAPGLRIGFVVAPAALLERMAELRGAVDRQGNLLVEAAVAELLEEGEVARQARRAQRLYQRRREVLIEALRRRLGDALSFTVPPGGMGLWTRAAPGIDVVAWRNRALAAGVLFQTGEAFTFDGALSPHVRLGFAVCDETELELAVRRMARTL